MRNSAASLSADTVAELAGASEAEQLQALNGGASSSPLDDSGIDLNESSALLATPPPQSAPTGLQSDAAFVPAAEGLPTYFLPMLADVARNKAYEAGIAATIQRFQQQHGRAPTVLDVGAGTGLLTSMALHHGAQHVTAVEANATTIQLMEEQLEASFPGQRHRYTLVKALSFEVQKPAQPYDMIICELLGSMIHSESMSVYLWDLMMRGVVQNFGTAENPVYYTVPQSSTMTVAPYRCPLACGLQTGLPYVKSQGLFDAVYGTVLRSKLDWTQDESRRMMLATAEPQRLGPQQLILQEQYDRLTTGGIHFAPEFLMQLPKEVPLQETVLVLEWKTVMAPGVILDHTLEAVAALPPAVQLARWVAWGHVFAPLAAAVDERSPVDWYRFSMAYRPADLEVRVQSMQRPPSAPANDESEDVAAKRAKREAEAEQLARQQKQNADSNGKAGGRRRITPLQVEQTTLSPAQAAALQERPALVPLPEQEMRTIVGRSKGLAAGGYTSV